MAFRLVYFHFSYIYIYIIRVHLVCLHAWVHIFIDKRGSILFLWIFEFCIFHMVHWTILSIKNAIKYNHTNIYFCKSLVREVNIYT